MQKVTSSWFFLSTYSLESAGSLPLQSHSATWQYSTRCMQPTFLDRVLLKYILI